ncbi:hypothetical protein OC846_000660 [Tilletia horrida]|uniref:C2H2-type domain-containing protein n=1 Tax=Tilletia horrida TaxID=155126 RepID=A0AAN6GVK9_9BASI|nr:hypothetical protein OC845_000793 [Tilletia horrida]KAK0557210.1 hypothetical protein OC846_000660 [Tilletia horrida]KAK0569761.1 hypothetical protein OC861_000598 [Tilletia horrida]
MGRVRHKRTHHARRDVSRGARTRARTLDQDQIHANLSDPLKRAELENPSELDPTKAGLGQFYCIPCDRHMPSAAHLDTHQRSKLHKRKLKKVTEEVPFTPEEAERAAGIGVDNRQRNSSAMDV